MKLDKSKIRKGKPVGLPYIGSKKKISKQIIEIIKQNFGTNKPIYDIFGGGGAITAECLINGLKIHYNDNNKTIIDCFEKIINSDKKYLETLIVSIDEFKQIKNKKNKNVDDNLKLLVNSFGYNFRTYLYSMKDADYKYNLSKEYFYKKEKTSVRVEGLERLRQLERLQQLNNNFTVTNKDYRAFSNIEGAIFYLDPPYENSTDYKEYGGGKFHDQDFYDWAYEMSKNNIVLISSYVISDPRFEAVFEFPNACSQLKGGIDKTKYEKLFMAKT